MFIFFENRKINSHQSECDTKICRTPFPCIKLAVSLTLFSTSECSRKPLLCKCNYYKVSFAKQIQLNAPTLSSSHAQPLYGQIPEYDFIYELNYSIYDGEFVLFISL